MQIYKIRPGRRTCTGKEEDADKQPCARLWNINVRPTCKIWAGKHMWRAQIWKKDDLEKGKTTAGNMIGHWLFIFSFTQSLISILSNGWNENIQNTEYTQNAKLWTFLLSMCSGFGAGGKKCAFNEENVFCMVLHSSCNVYLHQCTVNTLFYEHAATFISSHINLPDLFPGWVCQGISRLTCFVVDANTSVMQYSNHLV